MQTTIITPETRFVDAGMYIANTTVTRQLAQCQDCGANGTYWIVRYGDYTKVRTCAGCMDIRRKAQQLVPTRA